MRKKEGNKVFGVIGTGRFGLAVAQELLERGKYVIALDQDTQRLKPLYDTDAEVFVINDLSKESLMETGIQDADAVIVGIGKDVESSILAALNTLELGVKSVICKVISEDHAKILKKIGVEVIFPELDTGRRLAMRLSSNVTEDIFTLSSDFSIIQVKVPACYEGKTVVEADFRKKYGLNIIASVVDGKVDGQIGPQTVIKGGQFLVVAGRNDGLEKMQDDFDRLSDREA